MSIPLPPRVLHLWFTQVDLDRSRVSVLTPSLSRDELMRADAFRAGPDRDRFILIHSWLRRLLGRYLGRRPASLRFTHGPDGKPALAGRPPLHFNLSHCGNAVITAIRRDAEVGVDLERIDPRRVDLGIAERLFSPRENERLRTLTGRERTERFFQAWTRMEARAKATGTGLARQESGGSFLRVQSFRPLSDLIAAVASSGNDWIATGRLINCQAGAGLADNT